MQEIWSPCPGYENRYEISNYGQVRSLGKRYCGHLLSIRTRSGLKFVRLSKNGQSRYEAVHRLVAMAFVNNPLQKHFVIFIDGNKSNLKSENLKWSTGNELFQMTLWTLALNKLGSVPKANVLINLVREFKIMRA